MRLHRIRNDQLYHRYLGDPIEVLMLHENGTSGRVAIGPDLRAGQCVQLCYCKTDCRNEAMDCIQLDAAIDGLPGYCGAIGSGVSTICP